MTPLDQFPIDAEISLSEVRSEQTLTDRLHAFHRLRVRRRSDVVGILLDRDAWDELVTYVHRLEAEADRREDDAVRRIITERLPHAEFEPGSAERAADIFAEADRAVERFRTEGRR
jgi:hypothetical protein